MNFGLDLDLANWLELNLIGNPVVASHQLTEERTIPDLPQFQREVASTVACEILALRVKGQTLDRGRVALENLDFG